MTAKNQIIDASKEDNQEFKIEKNILTKEIQHQATVFAEPIFNFGNFTITNSLFTSWLVVGIILILAVIIRLKMKVVPKGLQNYFETMISGTINLADSVTGDRGKTLKFLPIVLPLFIFILLNNWLGLLPGISSIGFIQAQNNHLILVPFLRPGTADLNTTLALALITVILTHILGVTAVNLWQHFNRFVNLNLFLEIPRQIFKEKNIKAILINPIKFLVGLLEIISELTKVASLSFRLFGNIFAGEVLIATMAAIFAYLLPIPFIFLEILVGIIQALIFSILTLVFLSIMTTPHQTVEH